MAYVISDRVQETSATTGTGTMTLAGAVPGFRSFTSALICFGRRGSVAYEVLMRAKSVYLC